MPLISVCSPLSLPIPSSLISSLTSFHFIASWIGLWFRKNNICYVVEISANFSINCSLPDFKCPLAYWLKCNSLFMAKCQPVWSYLSKVISIYLSLHLLTLWSSCFSDAWVLWELGMCISCLCGKTPPYLSPYDSLLEPFRPHQKYHILWK